MPMLKVSTPSLIYAGIALLSALSIHLLYRLAEYLVLTGRLSRRDYALVPGLVLIITLVGAGLEWLDVHGPALLTGAGFSVFLGLNIGRLVPRNSTRINR